jgi:hypothetical protein
MAGDNCFKPLFLLPFCFLHLAPRTGATWATFFLKFEAVHCVFTQQGKPRGSGKGPFFFCLSFVSWFFLSRCFTASLHEEFKSTTQIISKNGTENLKVLW